MNPNKLQGVPIKNALKNTGNWLQKKGFAKRRLHNALFS